MVINLIVGLSPDTIIGAKMVSLSLAQVQQYQEDGYLVVEGFFSPEECESLRARCRYLVEEADLDNQPTVTFNTKNNAQAKEDYFLTSGDKIRYFFEEGAVGDGGKLTVPKHLALNKIGHALHALDPVFKRATFSEQVKGVARSLHMEWPAVVQSMYIFKQPHFGGSVRPHQDNTFLYTSPMTVVGFWIALEDADVENGCLWFIPKSHKQGLSRRMIRTMEGGTQTTKFDGSEPSVNAADFIAEPVKKGTLVLIDGLVVHKSEENNSSQSRHIYTFHLYDSGKSEWNEDNWLQPTKDLAFPTLY